MKGFSYARGGTSRGWTRHTMDRVLQQFPLPDLRLAQHAVRHTVPFRPPSQDYENYLTYAEVDEGAHGINVTSSTHVGFALDRNADEYLYSDKGAGFFTDFVHDFRNFFGAGTNDSIGFVWALSNDLDDFYGLLTAGKTAIGLSTELTEGGSYIPRIRLCEAYGGTLYASTLYVGGLTVNYHRIVKYGALLACGIYSTEALRDHGNGTDGNRGNLLLTLHAPHSFRYVHACMSYNDGTALSWTSNYSDNLRLNDP